MPATKNFPVFDCDSHVVEPPAIWEEYVPARDRAWVKSQFCFHTDGDLLMINGRVVPASRERSNAAETREDSTRGISSSPAATAARKKNYSDFLKT